MPVKKILGVFIASIIVAVMSPPPANAVLGGATADPNSVADSVVSLRDGACGAAMISPSWAITAKHCTTSGQAVSRVKIGVYGDGGSFNARAHRHSSTDLALINIDGIHHGTIASLPTYHARLGDVGQIVGFGASGNHFKQGQKADVVITETFTQRSSPYVGGAGTYFSYVNKNGKTALGDSGAPIFIGSEVHGVHAHDLSEMNAVSDYLGWIEDVTGIATAHLPNPLVDVGYRNPGNWSPRPMASGKPASSVVDNGPWDGSGVASPSSSSGSSF